MLNFKLIVISLFLVSCASESTSKTTSDSTKKDTEKVQDAEEITSSKRAPAKVVTPITIGDIKYSASLNEIVATTVSNNTMIWKKKIYDIIYELDLEQDVQDVFIDSIALVDSNLIVRNELGAFYFINLSTKEIIPNASKTKVIELNGYAITIGESSQIEFDFYSTPDSVPLLTEEKCIEEGFIAINTTNEIDLKLSDGSFFTLKKEAADHDQFYGYTFIHFDKKRNVYVLWENWMEAGHPIMVNGSNGKTTTLFGKSFCSNSSQTITANFASDIGAGWTPNGIQLLEKVNGAYETLLEFNPRVLLDENWGPVDVKWKNDNTLLVTSIYNDSKGGYLTSYKSLQFTKK